MNVFLWILQAALALFYFAGGAYKTFLSDQLVNQPFALPRIGWIGLGLFEMAFALLLIIPASGKWRTTLPMIAAFALAVETLGLGAFYASYSLELTAANPLVWSVAMGLLVAFVAFGRYVMQPSASRR
jgi:hypothetical protein